MSIFLRRLTLSLAGAAVIVLAPSVDVGGIHVGEPAAWAACETPALPGDPNAGVAGTWDPVDTSTPLADGATAPDPFAAGSTATIYSEYGWGAFKVNSYSPPDLGVPGCLDDRASVIVDDNATNKLVTATATLGAFTVSLIRLLFAPATLAFLDPVVVTLNEATGDRLFVVLFPVMVLIGAVVFLWRTRRDRAVAAAANWTLWMVVLTIAATVTALYGLTLGPRVDRAVTGVIAAGGQAVAQPYNEYDDPATPAPPGEAPTLPDVVGANLVQHVLYEAWCTSHFGRNPQAADEYCDDLFKAANYSRTEYAAIQANPTIAADMREQHEDDYEDVAEAVEDAYPEAYTYLSGERADSRFMVWFVALISLLLGANIIAVGVLFAWFGLLMVRLFIGVFPAFALIGVIPGKEPVVTKMLDYVVTKVVQGTLFCLITLVWIAAALGALNSPSAPNVVIALFLMALATYGLWRLLKQLTLLPAMRKVGLAKPRPSGRGAPPPLPDRGEAGREPDTVGPQPIPQPAQPAPRVSVVKETVKGAAVGAGAGLVTGGGALATGAAGAARGALGASVANRGLPKGTANEAPPTYYPRVGYGRYASSNGTYRPLPGPIEAQPATPRAALPAGSAAPAPAVSPRHATRTAPPQTTAGTTYTPPVAKTGVVLPSGTDLHKAPDGRFVMSTPSGPSTASSSRSYSVYVPGKDYR